MLVTAQFSVVGTPRQVTWDHATTFNFYTDPEFRVTSLEGVQLHCDVDPIVPVHWDLRVHLPPGTRLNLQGEQSPQPIQVLQYQYLVVNQSSQDYALVELRGNYQNGVHYITPVGWGPDILQVSFDSPLQEAYLVGLQPDPEPPPPPTLWEHLDDS